MMNLIDTYCHLNDPAFSGDIVRACSEVQTAGVTSFIVPAYDTESLERAAGLAPLYPDAIFHVSPSRTAPFSLTDRRIISIDFLLSVFIQTLIGVCVTYKNVLQMIQFMVTDRDQSGNSSDL